MSLLNQKIVLDELPDDRFLKNPLRTHAAAPALRVSAAPAKRTTVAQVATPARGGLFGRMAAAPAKRSHEDDDENGDDEDMDDDEDDYDEPPARAQPKRLRTGRMSAETVGTGPFTVMATTNKTKLVFIAGFKDVCGAVSKNAASVNLRFAEIVRAADSPEVVAKLNTFDPTRTVPISLRVLGTSLGEYERHCAVEVYDAAGKSLFSRFVQKHNSADVATTSGFPLFLLCKGASNTIMFNPPALSTDHKSYWSFNMDTLEKSTSSYANPTTGEQFKLIMRNSRCAALLDYALSVKNRIIIPRLLENPAYQLPDDANNLRVPLDLYNKTCAAYRKKLAEIQASSFDLSSVKVVLKPLDLAKEMGVVDLTKIGGHVAIEIFAHIPRKADLQDDEEHISDYMQRTAVAGGSEEDDSDEDI